jgi:flagellar basal-body rod modification protein FlgD
MSSPISALTGAAQTSSDGTTQSGTTSSVASQDTFLKLLVAQLQNQNPMQPDDGLQFVSEMAQFSQLEQVIGIKGDLDSLIQQATSSTGTQQSSGTGT